MDNLTLARLIGLALVVVIFVATIVLMPRILGVNPPAAQTPAPVPPEPTAASTGPAPAAQAPDGQTERAAPAEALRS